MATLQFTPVTYLLPVQSLLLMLLLLLLLLLKVCMERWRRRRVMADDILLLVLQSIPNNQLWLNTVIYNYVIGLFCLLNNHLEQKYYSLISVMSLLHFSATQTSVSIKLYTGVVNLLSLFYGSETVNVKTPLDFRHFGADSCVT